MSALAAASEELEGTQQSLARPTYQWGLSVARFLGRGARWATDEATRVAGLVSGAPASGPPAPEVLKRLSELLGDASAEHCEKLARDPEFWTLVAELHRQRPRGTLARPFAAPPSAPESEAGKAPAKKGKKRAQAAGDEPKAGEEAAAEAAPEAKEQSEPEAQADGEGESAGAQSEG